MPLSFVLQIKFSTLVLGGGPWYIMGAEYCRWKSVLNPELIPTFQAIESLPQEQVFIKQASLPLGFWLVHTDSLSISCHESKQQNLL